MKKRFVLFLVVLMVMADVCGLAYGKQEAAQKAAAPAQSATKATPAAPAKESAQETKAAAPGPVIGQQADRLLRQMSDYLKAAKQFSFHAEISYDDLLPSGQKLQIAATDDVLVRRPDRIYSEYEGETGGKRSGMTARRSPCTIPNTMFMERKKRPPPSMRCWTM